MPSDKVSIGPIRVQTHIGWFANERAELQELAIHLEFGLSTKQAATTDELAYTIDYGIALEIKSLAERSSYKLVETLTEQIAAHCLTQTQTETVKVTVTKFLPFDRSILGSVEIVRARKV